MANICGNPHSERLHRIKRIIEELAASQAGLKQEHKRLLTVELAALKSQQQLVQTQQMFAQAQQELKARRPLPVAPNERGTRRTQPPEASPFCAC